MTMLDDLKKVLATRSILDRTAMGEPPTTPHDEYAWQEECAGFIRSHGRTLMALIDSTPKPRCENGYDHFYDDGYCEFCGVSEDET